MDHMMPGMDGIEATRAIRNKIGTEYAHAVPIIALTANALVGNREMFMSNGFNDFLSKPIDVMQLDTVLNQWIRHPDGTPGGEGELNYGAQKQADGAGVLQGRRVNGVDLDVGVKR
jgi:DNA-binding response OmpR family regulator